MKRIFGGVLAMALATALVAAPQTSSPSEHDQKTTKSGKKSEKHGHRSHKKNTTTAPTK